MNPRRKEEYVIHAGDYCYKRKTSKPKLSRFETGIGFDLPIKLSASIRLSLDASFVTTESDLARMVTKLA